MSHNTIPAQRLRRATAAALLGTTVLFGAGCASINTVTSDVSSYGEWPAGRAASTYAFERLPSQDARAEEQTSLEAAARGAIERAGFKPASTAAQADVLVQVAARATRFESGYDDRWPRVSVWGGRRGYWGGWGLSQSFPITPRVDREVAVLLRDRASGKTLYETRAVNSGYNSVDGALLAAMFDAALKDFPKPAVSPRRVDTQLQPTMPSAGPTPEQVKIVR
jgi:hypothetical protein